MSKQRGFTLIELVIVIVILGLLAAVALPRFINLTTDARKANLAGLAGALNSAAAIARAQYIVTGSNAATTVTMDGTVITVLSETGNPGLGGIPTADANGIVKAAQVNTVQDYSTSGGGTAANSVLVFQPQNGGSSTCQVEYKPDSTLTGDVRVLITDTGC